MAHLPVNLKQLFFAVFLLQVLLVFVYFKEQGLFKFRKPDGSLHLDWDLEDGDFNKNGQNVQNSPRRKPWPYARYNVEKAKIFNVTQDETAYFVTSGRFKCLLEGTQSVHRERGCLCHAGYFGQFCSLPEAIRTAPIVLEALRPRDVPRKLIYATPFSIEFEMLEARIGELADIVDLFLISESPYSAHGDEKPLRLMEKLRDGYLADMQHKICYVHLGYFPPEAKQDGWIADALNRDILGMQGLKYQVDNVKDDDLFVMTDTDELPSRQALLFFKLHDGYAEPFGFLLHRTVFGFFWRFGEDGVWKISAGCTVAMVREVFDYKVSKLRVPGIHLPHLKQAVERYRSHVHPWVLGELGTTFVGWHCTWCTDVEGMFIKLESAINGDFPRWGDYPEKRTKKYVKSLIKHGTWFDDKMKFDPVPQDFVPVPPKTIRKNKDKYRYLLMNIYTDDVTI